MAWTDDAESTLRRMWADGATAARIANQLGGVTRSAVCGKVRRMHLPYRDTTTRLDIRSPRRPAPTPRKAAPPCVLATLPPPVPGAPELTPTCGLQDLTGTTCRWPIGDPHAADFGFCGRLHVPGLPYCAHHTARAYAPRPR